MSDGADIEDLDLLALADGHLDHDPARKAELEAAVARCPQASARLADYRAQTAALRAACAGALAEPVPERLYAIVAEIDRPRDRPVLRHAAAALLIVTAGLGGWILGRDDDDPARQALLDESYRAFMLRGPDQAARVTTAAAGIGERSFSWVDQDMAIRLSAPDLSYEGFALVDKRTLRDSGGQIVALDYAAPDAPAFTLFVAPRWENQPGPIVEEERDGVTLTYWHDGPLASSIATRLPPEQARQLAETVRNAMREETTTPPAAIEPDFRALESPAHGLVADTQSTPQGAGPTERTDGVASPAVWPN